MTGLQRHSALVVTAVLPHRNENECIFSILADSYQEDAYQEIINWKLVPVVSLWHGRNDLIISIGRNLVTIRDINITHEEIGTVEESHGLDLSSSG